MGKAEHIRFAVDRDDDDAFRTHNVVFREALTGEAPMRLASDAQAADYDGEGAPLGTSAAEPTPGDDAECCMPCEGEGESCACACCRDVEMCEAGDDEP